MKHQQAWTFGVQVFFSTIVLGLCTFQLVADKKEQNQAIYWGGLTGVLGYWLPSPSNSKNEEQEFLQRSQYNLNQMSNNGFLEQSETTQQAVRVTKTDE
ncbi:hypothetical protein [Mastigocladopsis repens]|uniref:hypothetical protein n=1 Tax=Mastigocladopsis repens TaxID=221287 RepID=UPI00030F7C98|nr:hypothetical protein [Mastigocladopsis repens]